MEIDFIISSNSRLKYKMFPIEVKSGKQYKTTSLNNFREKYKERIGESYIIHPRNLIVKDGIMCIPHIWRWIYKDLTYTPDNIPLNEKCLVVFFSRMGYVWKIAYEEANRSGAMLYEMKSTERTEGTPGFWWCVRQDQRGWLHSRFIIKAAPMRTAQMRWIGFSGWNTQAFAVCSAEKGDIRLFIPTHQRSMMIL